MLRKLLPKMHRFYEESHLAAEFHGFAAWLRDAGYSDKLIGQHLCRLRRTLEFGHTPAEKQWSTEGLKQTFDRYCKRLSEQYSERHYATRRAYELYLHAQHRLRRNGTSVDTLGPFRMEYLRYLEEVRGLCVITVKQHSSTVSEFIESSLKLGESLAHLTGEDIERYLSQKSRTCSRHTLQHVVARLRAFLRYALAHGLIARQLDVIDTPRTYRGELPPRALPWPLVKRLLSSIDRSARSGWRDYTMLHLMAYYGIRASRWQTFELIASIGVRKPAM